MNRRIIGGALITTFFAAIVTLTIMRIYTDSVLNGNLDNHVLSARMFGVPKALQEHGFKAFFQSDKETGWDGQFYYYIANDPLAQKDTAAHIDSDAYRYQRIGLPLLAWTASKLLLQDWVSPVVYYGTNVLVVLIATFFGARFFAQRGYGPLPILLWTFSLGVQLTLINGLPDAAADGLLIISFVSYLERRHKTYVVCATLAALSREAYVLFPCLVAVFEWYTYSGFNDRVQTPFGRRFLISTVDWVFRKAWLPAIPIAIFLAWQVFVRLHFHVAPSSQATKILGLPFYAWFSIFSEALHGHHPLLSPGEATYREVIALLLFPLLVLVTACVAWMAWRRASRTDPIVPVASATLALTLLYAAFGTTVMVHYTGYMKAAGLFFLSIPFLWNSFKPSSRWFFIMLLAVTDAYFGYYLSVDRLFPAGVDYERYVRFSQVSSDDPKACLKSYDARLRLVGMEDVRSHTLLGRLVGTRVEVFRLAVSNLTGQAFTATHNSGSVNVSYHWMTADGKKVVKDGIRSALPDGIAPGQTKVEPVVVEYPEIPGDYVLRFTLVQEGCTWFYNSDPDSKLDLDYLIR